MKKSSRLMQKDTAKRYLYVLAVYDANLRESEGPGALSFNSTEVWAVDEKTAYLLGSRWATQFEHLPVGINRLANDYVVAL